MSSGLLLSFLLGLTFLISCLCSPPPLKSATVERKHNPKTQFKSLQLSLGLSSTYRIVFSCKQNPKNLIINKFHPTSGNCLSSDGIDDTTLDKVKDELLIYWPIMTDPKDQFNYKYFQTIYNKDGRLCDGTFKGEKYFAKAIELTKLHRDKIYEALSSYGTPPSLSITYNASEIRKAIKGYTHKEPDITCYNDAGVVFLYEIMVCFDKLGRAFVACGNERPAKDCQENPMIIIPPLEIV